MSEQDPVTGWLWENRRWVLDRFKNLTDWFWKKPSVDSTQALPVDPRRILMIGSGGVGKTTFARMLAGERDWLVAAGLPYDESIGVESYDVDGATMEIVVAPGQRHRRDTIWPELERDLAAGLFRGIVLVVSYGYHNIGLTSYKRLPSYRGDDAAFLVEYLKDRRKDELAVLERLIPTLKTSTQPLWMLVIVTKQDLWQSVQHDVEKHYNSGRFSNGIEEIRQALGNRNFRYEQVLASLTISNFVTGEKELLQTNTAGYDSSRQIESLHRLFETLDALKMWEGTRS